ncbi:globin domain-containing protein [Methyloprofundus sp.]|uniref:globin domain-containing protein n=1 Tax=Methyloprofundus sp. TaxID=2020875 RepID=UPI003D108B36
MMYGVLLLVILLAYLLLIQNKKNQARYAQQYIEEEPYPLTPEQIKCIRNSWRRILPIKEKFAEMFYVRLFELDPALKSLFRGRLDFQGTKLMTTLNVVVNSIEDFNAVEAMLEAMGNRHIIYGVQAAHYETVGAALLYVLEKSLGEYFNDDIEDAWVTAYSEIANTMKKTAYPE